MADERVTKSRDLRDAGQSTKAQGDLTRPTVDSFLETLARTPPATGRRGAGRLIFALDATLSRQPTWDAACGVQAGMFEAASRDAGLEVQLVYFRGLGECQASRWVADGVALGRMMARIDCRGGHTQIGKVLVHARRQAAEKPVAALVYIGDAMEENADRLCAMAGELGMLGVKMFLFQEGHDPAVEQVYREMARLTGGAWCRFDARSADALARLLKAVAVYASGGLEALESRGGQEARLLIEQMRGK